MRFAALALFLLSLGASMALADLPRGDFKRAETALGVLEIAGPWGDEQLLWNGAPLGVGNYSLNIEGVYGEAGASFVWALVTSHAGGNACDPPFLVFRFGPQGVKRTAELGGCGVIHAARLRGGRFEVDHSDDRLTVSHRTYVFDGNTVEEVAVPAPVATPGTRPQGGAEVLRWVGQHPTAPLTDPAERLRFATIMSPEDMQDLYTFSSVANAVEQRGDWVVARGCFPHQCSSSRGGWAMRVSDGAVAAFMLTLGAPDRLFGLVNDPTVWAFIAELR